MITSQNNFLNNDKFWPIHAAVYSKEIPWFKEGNLFTHILVKDSKINSSFTSLLSVFKEKIQDPITDACLFLIPKTGKEDAIVHNLNQKTLVYILDSSNGHSLLGSIQKIETKQNSAISIDSPTLIIQKRQSDKDYIGMFYISFKNK
jgi:hypothetical protein